MMAEAMIAGLLRKKLADAKNIIASGPREARGEELTKKYGINFTTDNSAASHGADVVALSIKPQRLTEVMKGLKGSGATLWSCPSSPGRRSRKSGRA